MKCHITGLDCQRMEVRLTDGLMLAYQCVEHGSPRYVLLSVEAMAAIADNARAAFGPGQPIPRADALAIARDTLLRAERERLEIADAEAGRGIQYNEDGGLFV